MTIAPLRDARGLVVLADFQNLTNQPALGKTLMTASEADLRAIPGLSILDEEHVQAALTSLGEATDAVLSPGSRVGSAFAAKGGMCSGVRFRRWAAGISWP